MATEQQTHEVVVAFKAFPYFVTREDEYTGEEIQVELLGRRGETIKVNHRDFLKGQRLGAFETSEDTSEPEAPEATETPDLQEASVSEISPWYSEQKFTVKDVVNLVGEDPDLAQKMIEVEAHVTGGSPRPTLVEALSKVIRETS